MKTHLPLTLSLLLLTFANVALAGTESAQLWATMLSGGANGVGVIYSVNNDGSDPTVAFTFDGILGAHPSGNLVKSGNFLYGTTLDGGAFNCGVLFSYNTVTKVTSVLHSFQGFDGKAPRDIILASDGKLYGTTQVGGSTVTSTAPQGGGTIFSFDPQHTGPGSAFTSLFSFNGITGENPQGIIQGSDGLLYGLTRQGGNTNNGVLYSFDVSTSTPSFASLHNFNLADGALPTNCKIMETADHNFFGMTTWGGANDMGVIFKWDGSAYHKVFDFSGTTGAYPQSTLIQANNQVLYGVTSYGGIDNNGTLFSFSAVNNSYTDLHNFDGGSGSVPVGSLLQGSDNVLYGITTQGGYNHTGVIFSYSLTGSFSVVNNCDGAIAGGTPMGSLIELEQTATGIKDAKAEATVAVYPNPVISNVSVQIENQNAELISVYDLNGRRLVEAKAVKQIDLSTLAPGTYVVEVKNGNNYGHQRITKL